MDAGHKVFSFEEKMLWVFNCGPGYSSILRALFFASDAALSPIVLLQCPFMMRRWGKCCNCIP